MSARTQLRLPGDRGPASPGYATIGMIAGPAAAVETAYLWDIHADRIDWDANATDVLGVSDLADVATATGYQSFIAPEHVARRRQTMSGKTIMGGGTGVPYHLHYRFRPGGLRSRRSLWLEEQGLWWPGPNGEPQRARGVIRVLAEHLQEEQQRLLAGGDHDELTGQLNRTRLMDALGTILTRSHETGEPSAFLMARVNDLSLINDTFGFDVGDELIASASSILRSKLRAGDLIGRYSSNKFGIILNDCSSTAMRVAAERLIQAVRVATIPTAACQLSATVSIGGVLLPAQAATVPQAVNHALHALDRVKGRPSAGFSPFEFSKTRESARRRNITVADEIIHALNDNRLLLALQPIVRSNSREIALYEALLRLERKDGTLVSAGEFVHVAEQLGLARLIDRRALELAIALMRCEQDLRLSINVSSLTCQDDDWLLAAQRLTAGDRRITERLTVEITETSVIGDLDQSIAFVDTLKEIGCRVAIDDFGAGYTSFRNLKHLPVDLVKLDGAFVRNVAGDATDRIFVRTMAELARNFGMETVAEWVGDEETARICAESGITYLQGFYFGMPTAVTTNRRSALLVDSAS